MLKPKGAKTEDLEAVKVNYDFNSICGGSKLGIKIQLDYIFSSILLRFVCRWWNLITQ